MTSTGNKTIAEVARDYADRGWKPVPIDRKTKRAIGKDWQTRPFTTQQFNGNGQNVGIQLGGASGGLIDIDLDSALAIGLAPEFLPPTGAIFGRRSKPCSHQLYVSDLYKTEARAAIQYKDENKGVIVELRIGGNGKGAVTTFPPSMHLAGEVIQWVNDGDPARVPADALNRAVLKLAVACLLKPHYPGTGSRHDGAITLGGVLARAGWSAIDIGHVARVLARAAGDEEWQEREQTAVNAITIKANGHDISGFKRFSEFWGDEPVKPLKIWFRWQEASTGAAPRFSDEALALQFAERHAGDLRYVAFRARWLCWQICRWTPDETLHAFDLSRAICREQSAQCDRRAAPALASAKTVAAVERLAKADRRLAAVTDQWDTDPEAFNTPASGI
jgi:hypothetical protein